MEQYKAKVIQASDEAFIMAGHRLMLEGEITIPNFNSMLDRYITAQRILLDKGYLDIEEYGIALRLWQRLRVN
jgi:hypothetical protein